MSSVFIDASVTSPAVAAAGATRQARGTRTGEVFTMDWIQAAVAEGQVFGAQTGTGTSPTTTNAAYAVAEQDFYVYVPAGTLIIPVHMGLEFEDTGTALASDVFAAYSLNGDSAVTATALTAYNYKTGASPNTGCTVSAVVTAAGTTHLGGDDYLEFWRPYAGFGEDAFNGSTGWVNNMIHGVQWSAKQFPAPMIGSAGSAGALSIYMSGQAGIGFIQAVWAEYPVTRWS